MWANLHMPDGTTEWFNMNLIFRIEQRENFTRLYFVGNADDAGDPYSIDVMEKPAEIFGRAKGLVVSSNV